MKARRRGLTLVELLIVTIIVAVLAATLIPQFSESNKDAKMSNLKFNMRTVRAQLEAYKKDHFGAYPPAKTSGELKSQLTQKTNPNTTIDVAKGTCGPYLQGDLPANPFNRSTGVAILRGDTEPTDPSGSPGGWQYNPQHGWFYPNNSEYFQAHP